MPVLIGELEKITGSPSSVTQVMVRAHETRITGSALTTDELVPIPVDRQGRFEVPLRPGKAVLVLVHGGRVGEGERFPMLVEEGMGTITSAIKLASDRFDDYELDELERAAADMLASLDKGLVAATRAEVAKEAAEKARDKAGEHRDDAEKAAGTAAEDAATSAVQKADEKLSGYVTAAEGHAEDSKNSATSAGKDAGRAETARQGAETIQQEIPDKIDQELETKLPGELDTRVPAELDKHLPGELDERVPPLVAESIADDRAVADAAAAAVSGAAEDMDILERSAAEEMIIDASWEKDTLSADTDIDTIGPGRRTSAANAVSEALDLPLGVQGTLVTTHIDSGSIFRAQDWYVDVSGTYWHYRRSYWNGTWRPWALVNEKAIADGDAATLAAAKTYADTLKNETVPALGDTDLDTVADTSTWRQTSSANVSPDLHYPPVSGPYRGGALVVHSSGGGSATQLYVADQAGEIWVRSRVAGTWRAWSRVGATQATVPALGTTDLNTLTDTSTWRQTSTNNITAERHYPPINHQFKAGTLLVASSGGGSATQTYIADQAGEIWVRASVAGTWRDWALVGGQGTPTPDPNPVTDHKIPVLDMEVTGRWTPNEKGDAFLLALAAQHDQVQAIEIGRSVQDRPIYAAIIGDPTLPAVMVTAGLHGTEVGPPESAWLWIREMAQSKSLILMDLCIIVVPLVNPDNRFIARANKNVVDINRDWVDISQPETQAVNSLFIDYDVVAVMDSHNFGYPRHVSLLPANMAAPEVNALSQELYDEVFAAMENADELVRNYAPGLDERSLVQGAAILYNVPSLLIEIPCGGYGVWTFDDYYPPPSWQAHVGSIAYTAFAHHVWRNLPAFEALKSD